MLTSLRGIAALWVVAHNDSQFRSGFDISHLTSLIDKGYLAVDFFLVLSGFVLTYVYLGSGLKPTSKDYFRFIVNRIARIYPLYLLLLAARVGILLLESSAGSTETSSIHSAFADNHSLNALAANVIMVQAWGLFDGPTWIPSFWSISAEWFAYLIFPLLLVVLAPLLKQVRGSTLIASACLAVISFVSIKLNDGSLELPFQFSLARCLPEFTIGTALAALYLLSGTKQNENRVYPLDVIANLAVPLLLAAGIVSVHFRLPDVFFLALTCPVIPLAAALTGRLKSIATVRPLVYLGELSYAIYLSHMPVQGAWRTMMHWLGIELYQLPLLQFGLKLLMILCLSAALYHFVEIPARRNIRKLGERIPS